MSISQYRLLLTLSILSSLVGGGLDLVFPGLIPEDFQAAQRAQEALMVAQGYGLRLLFTGAALALQVASVYGLYRFRPWAPRLSVLATGAMLLAVPKGDVFAQSGISIAVSYLSCYLWGAALVLCHVPPFKAHFARRGG